MRSVRRISVVVLVVLCFLLIANPVAAGTPSSTELDWSEDYVEVVSDLHSPADKGTHSAFVNIKNSAVLLRINCLLPLLSCFPISLIQFLQQVC